MRPSKSPSRSLVIFCLVLLLTGSFPGSLLAQQKRSLTRASARPKVKLVVGIVIDQFRYDYLQRFGDQFGEGGFRRFLENGAVFDNANYIHTPTYTACGHATFMTGAPPALTGIVGNDWFDRNLGKTVTSVSDDQGTYKSLGGREDLRAAAPHKLLTDTLGDELRLATQNQAKVIGISYKDRSAILPAGKRPNGAYWFDTNTGNFISSTYYFTDLPEWMKKFNREQHCNKYFGTKWERLLPETAYQRSAPDNASYEKKSSYGFTFPYTLNGGDTKPGPRFYAQFDASPFANEQLAALAKAAIEKEALGADDITDLLTVSFSANDLVGHTYGPYSQEVQDITLRTDRVLADFFNYLDKKVGLNNVIITLTADHGVAPVPEQVKELGYGGRLEAKAITEAIQTALNARFGEEKWVQSFVNGNVYLDETILEKRKLNAKEVEALARTAIMKLPNIAECLTRSQISEGAIPQSMIARSVNYGFYAARNGNLVIVPQPFFFFGESSLTTHGSPYSYDTHVPVLFYGAGIKAGYYHNDSSPADIAPTLASLLKLQPPSSAIGKILQEAFRVAP